MITAAALARIYGCPLPRATNWAGVLGDAMAAYSINTRQRQAAFLAQIGHESGRLRHVREIWGPTPAQTRYEGRADLGNTFPGDGWRYRGRGLIQTTGRANYAATRDGLRKTNADVPDFIEQPDMLEAPKWAALSAGWFWDSRGLNALADAHQFERITRRINGGLNGHEDRVILWNAALAALT